MTFSGIPGIPPIPRIDITHDAIGGLDITHDVIVEQDEALPANPVGAATDQAGADDVANKATTTTTVEGKPLRP
ncbi:hypothetical protein MRS44_009135 [Fusarium solani]|uniref:uncharacterized protein n=1 Tax=Fusarium solani TaxID=169388 RepID=UPI0032C400D5|nr:hypothetical protein MRS44_009135 [Fusarium solani]